MFRYAELCASVGRVGEAMETIRATVLHPCPCCYPGLVTPYGDKAQQPLIQGGPRGNLADWEMGSAHPFPIVAPLAGEESGFKSPPALTTQTHWGDQASQTDCVLILGRRFWPQCLLHRGSPACIGCGSQYQAEQNPKWLPGTAELVSLCLGRSGCPLPTRQNWNRPACTFFIWCHLCSIGVLRMHL